MKLLSVSDVSWKIVLLRYGIGLVSIFITLLLEWLPQSFLHFQIGDAWLRDSFIQLQASTQAEQRLVVVDIDEASLKHMGPWPWPRTRLADLIEILLEHYHSRGIALDLILPDPADAAGDLRLAMLAKHGPLVLAQALDYSERNISLEVGELAGATDIPFGMHAVRASGYVGNHHILAAQAKWAGNIGFIPDNDGVIRHLPIFSVWQGQFYGTLAARLFVCCYGKLPIISQNPYRIPFKYQWSAYTVIPAHLILNREVSEALLSDRLVLVGSSALGLSDRVTTPLSPSTSGVLVHASVLSTLLDNAEGNIPYPVHGRWFASLYVIILVFISVHAFPRRSATTNVTILTAASLLWLFAAFWLHQHDPLFSPVAPLLSAFFLMMIAIPFEWRITQLASDRLLYTLRHYVAESVVDELLRRNLKDPLAPQLLEVTTLIADMEGYTSQVEHLDMQESAQLTRDFLECLTTPVLAHQGTLDKYTGDGLVAFWGAPLPLQDHVDLALDTALEIIEAVRIFSQNRQKSGYSPVRVRIGIESGMAMAGDFGTSLRSTYTAVGDSVNVASRLEQLGRNYPYDVIIGAGAASRVTRHKLSLVGELTLRGRIQSTPFFTFAVLKTEMEHDDPDHKAR